MVGGAPSIKLLPKCNFATVMNRNVYNLCFLMVLALATHRLRTTALDHVATETAVHGPLCHWPNFCFTDLLLTPVFSQLSSCLANVLGRSYSYYVQGDLGFLSLWRTGLKSPPYPWDEFLFNLHGIPLLANFRKKRTP